MSKKLTEEMVLAALRQVQDPDLQRDIVSLGFVKNVVIGSEGKISFAIELTTPACPLKGQLKAQAEACVRGIAGVKEVDVTMTARIRAAARQAHLPNIKHVVAVASGKGGVGKSTVSANLALSLAKTGAAVGLLDADIYGPSIPNILGIGQPKIAGDNEIFFPVSQYGIKVMSMAFFMPADKAVIWRGPMLDKAVMQFITGVEWGELDYLIMDLPPGTGDVQLSICQKLVLTGAVVVSTPQEVALSVAQRAIFMFQQLQCPILGMIENMSHYICSHCGQREEIFGSGGVREASTMLNIPFLGEIPLNKELRAASDEGKPLVVAAPSSPTALVFMEIAEKMAAQISMRTFVQ
jgi:ATP-binding protein involved in chromosome partitioning